MGANMLSRRNGDLILNPRSRWRKCQRICVTRTFLYAPYPPLYRRHQQAATIRSDRPAIKAPHCFAAHQGYKDHTSICRVRIFRMPTSRSQATLTSGTVLILPQEEGRRQEEGCRQYSLSDRRALGDVPEAPQLPKEIDHTYQVKETFPIRAVTADTLLLSV
jgi:hypothetical protein